MTIVASQDLGPQGVCSSPAVIVNWRWYYHLPGVAFWALALPFALLLPENRRPQAWVILLALAVPVLGARMLAGLLSTSPSSAEVSTTCITTLATAWTIVWLLGSRLGNVRGMMASLIALSVLYAVGLLSYLAWFGPAYDTSLPTLIFYYTLAVFGLLLPMVLTRRSCRKAYSRPRFMTWLLMWMGLTMTGSMLALATAMVPILSLRLDRAAVDMFLRALPICLLVGVVLATALYLMNLPFMIVAYRSDFYGERFLRVLRLKEAADPQSQAPGAADQAANIV